jgi:hypothetical protein
LLRVELALLAVVDILAFEWRSIFDPSWPRKRQSRNLYMDVDLGLR